MEVSINKYAYNSNSNLSKDTDRIMNSYLDEGLKLQDKRDDEAKLKM
jgi:hypothetical protein